MLILLKHPLSKTICDLFHNSNNKGIKQCAKDMKDKSLVTKCRQQYLDPNYMANFLALFSYNDLVYKNTDYDFGLQVSRICFEFEELLPNKTSWNSVSSNKFILFRNLLFGL